MLDFYLVDGDVLSHHKLSKNESLGSIDYAEFDELQKKKIIEPHLDYYKDFRWTNEQVNSKLKGLMTDPHFNDYKLSKILTTASELKAGIIANAD